MFKAAEARKLIDSLKGLDARQMLQIGSANQIPIPDRDLRLISRLLEKGRDEDAAKHTFLRLGTWIAGNSYNED